MTQPSIRRALALAAAAAGMLAALAGNPSAQRTGASVWEGTDEGGRHSTEAVHRGDGVDLRQLAAEVAGERDHVTAIELAQWIKDRKPGLRVLDLRTPEEFDEYHVPGARKMPLEELVSKRFAPDETIVLVSGGGAHAAQGWVLLRASGHERVYFLRGGIGEWVDDVMNPVGASPDVAALSRYFGGVPRDGVPRDGVPPGTTNSIRAMKRRGC